jgi:hypothetical protein
MPNLQMAAPIASLVASDRAELSNAPLASSIATNSIVTNSTVTLRKPKSFQWPEPVMQFCQPIQEWLDEVEVHDVEAARLLYKIIPGQCPFERDVNLFGRTLFHIPPICKLNPFYEQLVALRFRAMCYLVDECGETL